MPQPNQHSLVYILLLWTTIISIFQVVFTILFFTAGRNGLSQNSSAVEQEHIMKSQQHSTLSPPSKDRLHLPRGKMLTFTAKGAKIPIVWGSKNPNPGVVSATGSRLSIKEDGYFLLNLKVTLIPCQETQESDNLDHTVSLKWTNKVILEGWINTKTNSTGVLSKIEEMPAGGTLMVNISPADKCINTTESATHLDIIYMARP
ncbi:uncharacterized protein LOC103367173 isoform X1 [Stegastes partitus]|uniref:Uncharacterized protein LOC103367173 isoform X1 n=1 Tax=Stegastes partitus TaxID=144197 RepID=A0A9Y4KMX8_9TELE|nr:PREDICTED: uncharacterized protein LOC103367173 isoform X1 [Stegastes partitus]